jgi:DNA-binding Lrp family transcriptional regulator
MLNQMAVPVLDEADQRLIAALQCDGRLTAGRAAGVLGMPPRAVQRRLASLFSEAGVRVIALPARSWSMRRGVMMLRIKVLRGKMSALAAALAARDDIPFIDVSASGDELSAVLVGEPESLVFRQLPATSAVTAVEAQTVLHVFSDAAQWRLDALTEGERAQLTVGGTMDPPAAIAEVTRLDEADQALAAALAGNGRLPASAVARAAGLPETTVRRRLAALLAAGQLVTHVVVDPRRLGLTVDANLRMQVPPGRLDVAGRRMAAHPAVHGALATTGTSNLDIAVWLRDLDHLYEFITRDVAALGVASVDTMLVGSAFKRPGSSPRPGISLSGEDPFPRWR